MSLESDLFDALKGLVGNRMSPNTFPQSQALTWPAIRYQIISTAPVVDLCGDDGADTDATAETRAQLDVVATTYAAVRALRLQVLTAMASFDPPAILELSVSEFDPETVTHREILQYAFYGSS